MSCSNLYAPYLSVCLESLKKHASADQKYDIFIFENSISEFNKTKLLKQITQQNISLRFVDPSNIINNYSFTYPDHYAIECFFRLSSPSFLNNFEKIIFTDVDLIFTDDIAKLYNIDLSGRPLAACLDLIMNCFLNTKGLDWLSYCSNDINLKNPYEYFNTGVMIFDVKTFISESYSEKLLKLASERPYRILEQDVLNIFFEGNIHFLETRWNFAVANNLYSSLLVNMDKTLFNMYEKDELNPAIIHWAGASKPWYDRLEKHANQWWEIAKNTPYRSACLDRCIEKKFHTKEGLLSEYKKIKNHYIKYSILNLLTYGDKKKHYKYKKMNALKQMKDRIFYVNWLKDDI